MLSDSTDSTATVAVHDRVGSQQACRQLLLRRHAGGVVQHERAECRELVPLELLVEWEREVDGGTADSGFDPEDQEDPAGLPDRLSSQGAWIDRRPGFRKGSMLRTPHLHPLRRRHCQRFNVL